MHDFLTEWLVCPGCHGDLSWQVVERIDSRIESGQAICQACYTDYPIRDGIGIFLLAELPREDLWQEVDSGLTNFISDHPELDEQLTQAPLTSLNPADQFFRAMVLEERGEFASAARAESLALEGLYTPEYRACSDSQGAYVIEQISKQTDHVVDLASGRGHLVERLAALTDRFIVATDFSPKVLRRNRLWLEYKGLHERVSLLAFDARRTPFRTGIVPLLTTYLGLPNIERPSELLVELRRIVGGNFLAVSHFFPADDQVNGQALRQFGLDMFAFKDSAIDGFTANGWQVRLANSCWGLARPTPTSELIGGAGIDGFPVVETRLEWGVIEAR